MADVPAALSETPEPASLGLVALDGLLICMDRRYLAIISKEARCIFWRFTCDQYGVNE